ncbi:DUF896 domain-containing protein [Caloramator sp. Dgby_cultured_2]|uniref:DUF896 domain-containing protein n=1 Tax=Caloramator sp. Dgby_cultured_2 TaxID=3029174 RepID=UPI00237D53FF|nr:DUF896 domain-containing protein [Caloramator sp. Dgby_cultured_2]WDU83902.1 DUF896 domain-containing protein [Caloramator sp. Dgby_cultured_2]
MITKEQIKRINELYKKQVEGTLTEEEKKEQAYLRRLYVDSVKESLKAQLDNIKIVTPEEYEKLQKKTNALVGMIIANISIKFG